MNELERMLSANGSIKYRERKTKRKRRKCKDDDEDDNDDDIYHPSQDYNDDSLVDPEFRPTKRELKEADKEGDS